LRQPGQGLDVPVQHAARGGGAGRRSERLPGRGHHLVLTTDSNEESAMNTEPKGLALVFLCGALAASACVIPEKSAPSAPPGSAASIGGGTAAASSAAFKDCGPDGVIDDGEDGNNQNLPNAGRGGYWYTFKDKGTTSVDPQAGEEGGTFAMSE